MIRIETTAEFDAEGQFTVTGQTPLPVSPGSHRVTVILEESVAPRSAALRPGDDTGHPLLKWIDGVLVWTGPVSSDIDTAHREILDERDRRMLEGPWE
jgi:hypothetical protein